MIGSGNTVKLSREVEYKINRPKFSNMIDHRFSQSELTVIIYEMEMEPDNIPGRTKREQVFEFVEACQRHDCLGKLWELCRRQRVDNWENVLEQRANLPGKDHYKYLVGILGAVCLLLAAYIIYTRVTLPHNKLARPVDDDVVFVDFEESEDLRELVFTGLWDGDPWLDTKTIYAGDSALGFNVNLTARENYGEVGSFVKFEIPNVDMYRQTAVFHVYIPKNAPTNLAGQISLPGRGIYGTFTYLKPGAWKTVAWSSEFAPLWEGEAGLEFSIILAASDSQLDAPAYNGPVYIDSIQIFPMIQNYSHAKPLSSVLERTHSYEFKSDSDLLDISAVNEYVVGYGLTTFDFHDALQLSLAMPPHDSSQAIERNAGGIAVSSPDEEYPVEAVSVLVYVPEGSFGQFKATFAAHENQENGPDEVHYSTTYLLTPGKWNPVFWGLDLVEYVDGERTVWNPDAIDTLKLWITNSEGYYGSRVYIDSLTLYTMYQP